MFTKIFDILLEIILEYQIRPSSYTFWVLSLYLNMFDQNLYFLCIKLQFWSNISKNRPKNSSCFSAQIWYSIKHSGKMSSYSKQSSKLRIHSKPYRNQSKLSVCNGSKANRSRTWISWFFKILLRLAFSIPRPIS